MHVQFRFPRSLTAVFLSVLFACFSVSAEETAPAGNPTAIIHTNMGDIKLELFADRAPVSTANFVNYANSSFYNDTVFHRVIADFMIQGGGFTADMKQKPTAPPIANEADNGLSNIRGTIAMARTNDPNSATAQFFINVKDNTPLDHRGKSDSRAWGYAVFGKVTSGMDVVDQIRMVETKSLPPYSDVPVVPVVIERVQIIKPGQE
jgi:cyclophilin family peptidyl-prolyl cis-trans isomerase